jgi:hypothetical protein
MRTRCLGRVTGVSVIALLVMSASPAPAQSTAVLREIIRQQERQLEELARKVEELQRQTEEADQKAEAAAETAQKVEEEAPDVKVEWAPGPTFSSKDGSWSVHVRGRLMVDGGGLGDEDDFYKNDSDAAADGDNNLIYGVGVRAQVDW